MPKSLFSAAESASLIMAAYSLQSDKDAERFLTKLEAVLVAKLFQDSETARLLTINKVP